MIVEVVFSYYELVQKYDVHVDTLQYPKNISVIQKHKIILDIPIFK